MNLMINGEEKIIEENTLSITELLKNQNIDMPDMVSVEHNGTILEREAFSKTTVSDGDTVEFLYFMGGGV